MYIFINIEIVALYIYIYSIVYLAISDYYLYAKFIIFNIQLTIISIDLVDLF